MKIVKENVGGGQAPATAQDLELIDRKSVV